MLRLLNRRVAGRMITEIKLVVRRGEVLAGNLVHFVIAVCLGVLEASR